jgi:NACalpha-BTF3-like transcription factor
MQNTYDWLLKKTPRSVRNLHLWESNPRLDPENTYVSIKDFAEEMTVTDSDRSDFISLIKSIVKKGFIPADPIVIWQDAVNKKFFVAEGNRRITALKLLLEPHKSPKGLKNIVIKLAKDIDPAAIEKVHVSVAPTFEEAEWYISQRNSITSLQKRWQREQQQRWVAELYEKYDGDIDIIRAQAGVDESDLESILRTLKLKALVKEVENDLTEKEFANAVSHRFPISSLERFFNTKRVKDDWGLEFVGTEINISKDRKSFLNAYAALIKRMVLPRGDPNRIDSRTITDKLDDILGSLPNVDGATPPGEQTDTDKSSTIEPEAVNNPSPEPNDAAEPEPAKNEKKDLKNDPNRSRLILPCYDLHTDNYRLSDLFSELKSIPLKYKNSVAASIRIFLDLAVLNYIEAEQLTTEINKFAKMDLRQITLSRRLEFLKERIKTTKPNSVIQKLLNRENELSLDVLNGYVHNNDSHYLDMAFINKFWDFLFPLFQELLDIKEV